MPALLAIQIAMPVLGAMMLVMVWSLRRCDVPGVRQWWQGNVAVAMSLLLFGLRGHASDLLSVITANLLLLWGSAQFYAGLLRFSGRRPDWRRWWAIAAVTAGVVAWRYGRDDFNLRVACVSALQAALSLHAGIVLLRRDREPSASAMPRAATPRPPARCSSAPSTCCAASCRRSPRWPRWPMARRATRWRLPACISASCCSARWPCQR